MNYKTRLTLLFVGLFLIVLTSILTFIYFSYADMRRDEFFERLHEKSFTTARLLLEVKGIDKDLLKLIDQNSINKMYDEKVLVFNEKNELIYSSLDDETIPYSETLINQIREKEDKFYVDKDGDEVVGVHYTDQGHDYVVLASAYDTYGISKLENLKNIVIFAMVLGAGLIALSSYFYIRQVFRPIDALNRSIQVISEKNLHAFIKVKKNRDELDRLAINYNQMLERLYKAFESQRSFVRNASHELKTPLALIQGRLELLAEMEPSQAEAKQIMTNLMNDLQGQADLIDSLLLIQRLQSQVPVNTSAIRIDELLYESAEELGQLFPEKIQIDIAQAIQSGDELTLKANAMLLKTCFRNLIENAGLYGRDGLSITIAPSGHNVEISFINRGDEALPAGLIFEPFYRQPSQQEKPGNGLGLSIVKQIVELNGGQVSYSFENNCHIFRLLLPQA
ncbi:HAMP domain-containing histidine kinase [Fulvivirgaceae bacterium PWU4]|uniref:histidine kinase n=1 Tax=Chryseosolibacter histidini TaxID=2782349 RepID=A0AAP2DQQ1_9BACT|nr:HAMP domain-containing sensor histidine kinase [Chryseosolibacter histidini]MBT1700800.1 HAMP domain-containing histidine kinase [Chryseosolibacter histidini]